MISRIRFGNEDFGREFSTEETELKNRFNERIPCFKSKFIILQPVSVYIFYF